MGVRRVFGGGQVLVVLVLLLVGRGRLTSAGVGWCGDVFHANQAPPPPKADIHLQTDRV